MPLGAISLMPPDCSARLRSLLYDYQFYSNGLPRKISNICTNALIRTVASGLSVVNKDIVEYVAKEIRLNPELMKVKRIGRPKKTEIAQKPA